MNNYKKISYYNPGEKKSRFIMINEACFHNILSGPSRTKDPSTSYEGKGLLFHKVMVCKASNGQAPGLGKWRQDRARSGAWQFPCKTWSNIPDTEILMLCLLYQQVRNSRCSEFPVILLSDKLYWLFLCFHICGVYNELWYY